MNSTAIRAWEETGKEVTYVLGRIPVRTTDGGTSYVRGVYSKDGIIIQADNLRMSIDQIADHEIFHDKTFQTPGLIREIEQRIVEKYGEEEFAQIEELLDKGLTPKQYVEYKTATDGLDSDKDAEGKTVQGSKKKKVLAAIDAMNISDSLKTTLYFAEGYTESTLDEAPWYNGLIWAGS